MGIAVSKEMKAGRIGVLSILLLALLVPIPQPAQGGGRGELSVMTINLLFTEIEERDQRLDLIADYVANNGVDLVLLQEVVGGTLERTFNSALDLRRKLARHYGLRYDLAYRMANGLPGLLTVGNAILSRYDIVYTVSKTLPFESEEIFQGIEIPLKRKVVMSRVNVPNFGPINVYDVHLCAYCDPWERLEQTEVLVDFVKRMERVIPGDNPVILGGDFNISDQLISYGDDLSYDLIIDAGFFDAYGEDHDCVSCCEGGAGIGCTYAVDDNPYAVNPFTGQEEETVRIDYIFLKGGCRVLSSEVAFTEAPFVSDHSAVVTRLKCYR